MLSGPSQRFKSNLEYKKWQIKSKHYCSCMLERYRQQMPMKLFNINHYDLKYGGLVLPHMFVDITLIELTYSIFLDKCLMKLICPYTALEISDESLNT